MHPHIQSENKSFTRLHSAGQVMVMLFQDECSMPSQMFKYKVLLFQEQAIFIFLHVTLVAGKVFKHNCDTGKLSALFQQ
jgi:hypothetical protein